MGKPKLRTYYVHEVLTVTNVFEVLASNKAEAVAAAKETHDAIWETDAMPTGEWYVEPRPRKKS